MKPCENIEITLSALVDLEIGEIEPKELLKGLDHLVECSSCQDFYRQARGLEGVLALLRDPRESPALPAGGWQHVARASELQPRWRQRSTKVLAAAAAVVFAVGLWTAHFALQPGSGSSESLPAAEMTVASQENRESMTDHRFIELTTELLRSDRRYQDKMQEVLVEVSSRSFIAEGSNDANFLDSTEAERELPEVERDDPFVAFAPLWW